MHPAPDERPINPYGTIQPRETGRDEVPWNRPDVPFSPPSPGYNSAEWHPGPEWNDNTLWPWLKGPTRNSTLECPTAVSAVETMKLKEEQ
jgi:hypothetical protein